MPARAISITNHHPRLRLDRRALVRAIHTLDANHPAFRLRSFNPPSIQSFASGELSLVFLTDPELSRLHADFLADPTPTDVITFEGDSTHGTAGEICVSVDAAWRHTRTAGLRRQVVASARKSDAAFSSELTLYVVHGWLHLAGYDDLVPAQKRAMRRAEARALRLLHSMQAMPVFALKSI